MDILFVSDFVYNPNSGAAGSLIVIGKHISALGHPVKFIWGVESKKLKSPNLFGFLELPFVQHSQLKKALQEKEYDIVVVSQPYAWWAVKKLSKSHPHTVFINRTHGWEYRITPVNWAIDYKVPPPFVQRLKNAATLFLIRHYCRLTVKYFKAVLCASSSDANFIKHTYRQAKRKVFTIAYGLDESFLGIPVANKNAGVTSFLFAGQYVSRKGTLDLVDVFKKIGKINNIKLSLIIDNPSVEKAKRDFSFLDNDSLTVQGWVDRTQLLAIYKQHDVFLMPSYGEGFGKTSLEAMACGLCCIGYAEGALEDIGRHMHNSLLSKTGDTLGLEENITYAIRHPEKIREMGRVAYSDVQPQTWAKNAVQTVELFNALTQTQSLKSS